MRYLILTATECNEMMELVQNAISIGYEPLGGLGVGKTFVDREGNFQNVDLLYQAMIDRKKYGHPKENRKKV